MKFAKSFLMGTGAVVMAGLVLMLVAPKAAHAIAATAVQVENTRSSPVPNQDVDIPGRHPYQQQCGGLSSGCTFPAVPPNTELVIQTVSIFINGGSPTYASLGTGGAGVLVNTYIPLVAVGGGNFTTTQQITQYADPGSSPTCNGPLNSNSFSCTIIGYTVSLP
jgi:hypothetical protein